MKRRHEIQPDNNGANQNNSGTPDAFKQDLHRVLDRLPKTEKIESSKGIIHNLIHIIEQRPHDVAYKYQLGFELYQVASSEDLPKEEYADELSELGGIACKYLRQAIALEPNYIDAYRVLNLLIDLDDEELEFFIKLLLAEASSTTDDQKSIKTYLEIAKMCLCLFPSRGHKTDTAITCLQEVVKKDPTNPQANILLGKQFRNPDLAISYFTRALEGDKNNAEAYYQLGEAHFRVEKASYRRLALDEKKELDPKQIRAYFKRSLNALDRAIELKLTFSKAYSLRARIYMEFVGYIEEGIWNGFQKIRFQDSPDNYDYFPAVDDFRNFFEKIDEAMLEKIKCHPKEQIRWLGLALGMQSQKSQKTIKDLLSVREYGLYGLGGKECNLNFDAFFQDYSQLEKEHQEKIKPVGVGPIDCSSSFFSTPIGEGSQLASQPITPNL